MDDIRDRFVFQSMVDIQHHHFPVVSNPFVEHEYDLEEEDASSGDTSDPSELPELQHRGVTPINAPAHDLIASIWSASSSQITRYSGWGYDNVGSLYGVHTARLPHFNARFTDQRRRRLSYQTTFTVVDTSAGHKEQGWSFGTLAMYQGFDLRLIDINRTCKVTKGGQVVKYTVLMVCVNYRGVVGYAKAKADAVPIAIQRAHEKCFQNLHYIERHEEHTIAHAIQESYKKTKVYLWPAPTASGMRAGRTVENILLLAGFNNIKSKVIGSRNPHNTVKAVFKALDAVETPKDMQEKFGRAVVEKHLLQLP
ncbi:30S ribosomal protein S5-like [Hibiscus syriacus]|uniref:30S ribosomal protein S5-like n=1 Tax=Hibiscus syriacus TaxID=106335 RepID=UPI001920583D|nr:30S ribosomal protein S5-like [Hibiscus syriacus]